MKVRDLHATLEGDTTVIEMPSKGLEIVSDDGRTLFSLRLKENELHVSGGVFCRHAGKVYDGYFVIKPVAANCVELVKVEYKEGQS